MEVKNQTLIWLNARGEDNEHDEGPQSQQTKTFITQSCQLQNEGYLIFMTVVKQQHLTLPAVVPLAARPCRKFHNS